MKATRYIKDIIIAILLCVAYVPTFIWMWDRWMASESYYGHGILIPLVCLYVLWRKREVLRWTKKSSEVFGLIIIAFGLFIHIICALLKVYFISGFSFVFVIYGLVLFFFGKEIVRKLVFPIFFLLAMIPLPLVLIGNLTVKLKLFVTQGAVFILNRIGFPSIQDGAPCSGLSSLISLMTLGLIFAYVLRVSFARKSLLFLSSVPIALASNLLRISILSIVNDLYGEEAAMGFFHNFSGFFVFAFAFIGLLLVSKTLETNQDA